MRFSLLLNVLGVAAVEIPARNRENGLHRRSEAATIQPAATANNEVPVQGGYIVNSPEAQTYGADSEPETSLVQVPQVTQSVSIEEDDEKDEQQQEEISVAVSGQDDVATETSPRMVYNLACSCNQPAPTPTITGGYPVDPPPAQTTTSQPSVVPYPPYSPPAPITTSTTEETPVPNPPTSSTYPAPEPSTTTSETVVPYPPPSSTYPQIPTTTTEVSEPPSTTSETPLPPTTTTSPPVTTQSW
jgi:hypothetical protein